MMVRERKLPFCFVHIISSGSTIDLSLSFTIFQYLLILTFHPRQAFIVRGAKHFCMKEVKQNFDSTELVNVISVLVYRRIIVG